MIETCVVECDLSFIYQQRVDVYTLIGGVSGGVSAYACNDVSNFQIVICPTGDQNRVCGQIINIEAFIL
ncbi:hypothetical protein [Ruminococcus sp. FC2018]|uniref:hypothetical protein n=1 Tax=Ruminococcus sp. FC2018 TaxID=1410617 RepID=UPI0012DF5816|nr:hypothetical protein [Ruminococcus sp. FC2018]